MSPGSPPRAMSGRGRRHRSPDQPRTYGPRRHRERSVHRGSGGRPYVAFWELDPGTGSTCAPGNEPARVWVMRLSADGSEWQEVGGGPVNENPSATLHAPGRDHRRPAVGLISPALGLQHRVHPAGAGGPPQRRRHGLDTGRRADRRRTGRRATFYRGGSRHRDRGRVIGPSASMFSGMPQAAANGSRSEAALPPRAKRSSFRSRTWVAFPGSAGPKGADARAARLDEGAWRQAGGAMVRAVGPSSPRSTVSRGSGSLWRRERPRRTWDPGCCDQARVARLEPDFGPLRAFPSPDTAALLSELDTFGLPYPVRFEYGEERDAGATGATTEAPADGDFVVGEARGLRAATLYWFQPFAKAGTPLPLVPGPRDHFATPPASAAGPVPGLPRAPRPLRRPR